MKPARHLRPGSCFRMSICTFLVLGGCDSSSTQTTSSTSSAAATTSSGGGGASAEWTARCHDGWCFIPAGTFVIGSPESEWSRGAFGEEQVDVTLTRPFVLQQYEVTIPEWTRFGWNNPSTPIESWGQWCQDDHCPIGNLNWFDVVTYANKLSELEGRPACYELVGCTGAPGDELRCETAALTAPTVYECSGYRLPTEAEWEYAARAGTTTAFYSGDITPQIENGTCFQDANLDPIAWYCHNSEKSSHPIGLKAPNRAGLYDILGNASEWMHNDTQGTYGTEPLVDPFGTMNAQDITRVIRGGAWNFDSGLLRAAAHHDASWYGFGSTIRLARTLAAGESWPP